MTNGTRILGSWIFHFFERTMGCAYGVVACAALLFAPVSPAQIDAGSLWSCHSKTNDA